MSVIWITGLAASGKTTLAQQVAQRLTARGHIEVAAFDGDAVRRSLGAAGQGYARPQRLAVARHIAALAAGHSRDGGCAVVSTISLFHEIHAGNRAAGGDYFEVLLECAPQLRAQRLAARDAQTGPQVGHELTPEWPRSPHLRLDSGAAPVPALADALLRVWERRHV
ncbi:adenylyl-sulfate kinase [Tahibacter sp. UC22_41]|uniref:adenylyl-sulfate kinase n=1 Tax=Tahibacter sp. UC22_41 TaxID=3350178 RepID=UPI0036DA123B